jgi:hypothetical protein
MGGLAEKLHGTRTEPSHEVITEFKSLFQNDRGEVHEEDYKDLTRM